MTIAPETAPAVTSFPDTAPLAPVSLASTTSSKNGSRTRQHGNGHVQNGNGIAPQGHATKGMAPKNRSTSLRRATQSKSAKPQRDTGKLTGRQTTAAPKPADPVWQVVPLPVAQIEPNPFQPRVTFDAAEMADLVDSVRTHGVLQPITVRTNKLNDPATGENTTTTNTAVSSIAREQDNTPSYHLVAGERRLRACQEAGRKTIPAIIRDDLSNIEAAELALVENVQRSNLNVIEEANGYKRLMLIFRLKEERIAKKVGKSVATIKDTLRLLALPAPVQHLLSHKQLTPSHGQQLLRLAPFEQICALVANKVAGEHLTAVSLAATPLPNARELLQKKLIVELGYKTQFDWKETCGDCPHKAYEQSGYSAYCLKPEEWRKKQEAAIALKEQEATQVLVQARQAGRTEVDTQQLTPGSYRDLSFNTPPAGCSAACPCRGEASSRQDPTQKVPICLNPARFQELRQAEREAHEAMRRQRYTALWQEAKAHLQAESERGECRSLARLFIRQVLYAQRHLYSFGEPEVWQALVREVGQEISIELSWPHLWDEEEPLRIEALQELDALQTERLLLFAGCLLLAQETQAATRFAGPTPALDLVLGRTTGIQPELDANMSEAEFEEFASDEFEPDAFEPNGLEVEDTDLMDSDVANSGMEEWEVRDLEGENTAGDETQFQPAQAADAVMNSEATSVQLGSSQPDLVPV